MGPNRDFGPIWDRVPYSGPYWYVCTRPTPTVRKPANPPLKNKWYTYILLLETFYISHDQEYADIRKRRKALQICPSMSATFVIVELLVNNPARKANSETFPTKDKNLRFLAMREQPTHTITTTLKTA